MDFPLKQDIILKSNLFSSDFSTTLKKAQESAVILKKHLVETNTIKTMWQMDNYLKSNNLITSAQALAFYCPVYFSGQRIVQYLLNKKDEQDELMLFPLPAITEPERIKHMYVQMKRLGISNPERFLKKDKKTGKMGMITYSSLPGVEGVGSGHLYEYIAHEFVQLGAFQIVPKEWLNAGDPVIGTYRFPGELGYSPYWRIPTWKEFKSLRPDLAKNFKETNKGIVKR